jgi:hypothetical protein
METGEDFPQWTQWQGGSFPEWPVLAGFWPENTIAVCVPSLISACTAAKMLEGVFSRIIRVA